MVASGFSRWPVAKEQVLAGLRHGEDETGVLWERALLGMATGCEHPVRTPRGQWFVVARVRAGGPETSRGCAHSHAAWRRSRRRTVCLGRHTEGMRGQDEEASKAEHIKGVSMSSTKADRRQGRESKGRRIGRNSMPTMTPMKSQRDEHGQPGKW